jgi:hypothetical protein
MVVGIEKEGESTPKKAEFYETMKVLVVQQLTSREKSAHLLPCRFALPSQQAQSFGNHVPRSETQTFQTCSPGADAPKRLKAIMVPSSPLIQGASRAHVSRTPRWAHIQRYQSSEASYHRGMDSYSLPLNIAAITRGLRLP